MSSTKFVAIVAMLLGAAEAAECFTGKVRIQKGTRYFGQFDDWGTLDGPVCKGGNYVMLTGDNDGYRNCYQYKDLEQAAAKKCDEQTQFDILMCTSHMCTKCVLSYCTETCQAVQGDFPGCRCADWPTSRASFSSGDFAGKGTYGDSGDYAKVVKVHGPKVGNDGKRI